MKKKYKFKLKKLYPSIPEKWDVSHEYTFFNGVIVNESIGESITTRGDEINSYCWQLIGEKKPLFTTVDGVELFNNTFTLYAVGLDFITATSNKWDYEQCESEGYKLFYHKSNADEYIWRNKRVFSYEDFIEHAYSKPKFRRDIEQIAKERCE